MTPKQKRRAKAKSLKNKIMKWATKDDGPFEYKHFIIAAALMLLFLSLVGCARPGHEKGDTYKIMLGTKCADNGTVQSPIWFHTTIGPDQVSKGRCQ